MGQPEPKKELDILGLVDWLDGKQNNRKDPLIREPITELFRGERKGFVIAPLISFFIIWFGVYEYAVHLTSNRAFTFDSFLVVLTALLSAIAVEIAGLTFIQPYIRENETNVRYRRALNLRKKDSEKSNGEERIRDFTEEEKPLVKALIIIMGNNKEFTLRQLYDADRNQVIFSRDRLLERLCSREELK